MISLGPGTWVRPYSVDVFEDADVNRRERVGLRAARDEGEAWTRDGEDEGGRARARDGDVATNAARRGLAAQLLADRLRRPEQPLQSADVDRHEIAAMQLVARRKLLRDRGQRFNRRER